MAASFGPVDFMAIATLALVIIGVWWWTGFGIMKMIHRSTYKRNGDMSIFMEKNYVSSGRPKVPTGNFSTDNFYSAVIVWPIAVIAWALWRIACLIRDTDLPEMPKRERNRYISTYLNQ